jgi:hypothetical protein
MVLSKTVALWQNSFQYIQDIGMIKKDTNFNNTILSKALFLQHFAKPTHSTIDIWYYMKEDNVPRIAIQVTYENLTTDSFLIHNSAGEWVTAAYRELSSYFTAWKTFTEQPTSILAYVQRYKFNAAYIESYVSDSKGENITIENVVHSVEPQSDRYQVNEKYVGSGAGPYEGFLALDILFKIESSSGAPHHYNFAKPCPKLCDVAI